MSYTATPYPITKVVPGGMVTGRFTTLCGNSPPFRIAFAHGRQDPLPDNPWPGTSVAVRFGLKRRIFEQDRELPEHLGSTRPLSRSATNT